ncbi:unnamed protein product [Musa banksii]
MKARYLMSIFVVSVLPAPLSPLTKIDWLPWSFMIALILPQWQFHISTLQLECDDSTLNSLHTTCSKHLQLQKDEDLAHRKQHPCTVPSCGHHTDVEVSERGSRLSIYFQC